MIQVCPQHGDEEVEGERLDVRTWRFVCHRRGHVVPGDFEWPFIETPPGIDAGDGITAEYNLMSALKQALASVARHSWVEYGLIERAYAERNPEDFRALVARYGHTAVAANRYTVSALLGGVMGRLTRAGEVLFRWDAATQYWAYNQTIGWYALGPLRPDSSERMSCEDTPGYDVHAYVPGAADPVAGISL